MIVIENEVAQRMANYFSLVDFDSLENMWVLADDEVRPGFGGSLHCAAGGWPWP